MFNSDPASAGTWPAMHGSVGALITTFLVIPVVTWMSKKLGRKKLHGVAVHFNRGLRAVLVSVHTGQTVLFLFALPFHSFGIGSLFTIMMSMTADVCDLDELRTGKRRKACLAPCIGGWSNSALELLHC